MARRKYLRELSRGVFEGWVCVTDGDWPQHDGHDYDPYVRIYPSQPKPLDSRRVTIHVDPPRKEKG